VHHIPAFDPDISAFHIQDYRFLMESADRLLENPEVNYELLHLPVPHPPGFYDRKTETFSERPSTYIDNLTLADRTVAHIREKLEHEDRWDNSAVILMGDHSWRTSFLWARDPAWTKEEAAASKGGQFDERPAYIVKLPGQQIGTRIDTRFGAVYTRAMLDEIMHGRLRTPEELAAWVIQQPQVASPVLPK
jgi:arylsulfatase A-like enzyme